MGDGLVPSTYVSQLQRLWRASGLMAFAVGAMFLWRQECWQSSCSEEARDGSPQRAISLCRASYQEHKHPQDLLWLARSYLNADQREQASQAARSLLHGPLRGSAHQILSYCAMRDGSTAAAMVHALLATAEHAIAHDELELVTDEISLSQAAWQAGDFSTALAAADRALKRLEGRRDAHKEVMALIARADALRRMGDLGGASKAAKRAIGRATTSRDRAWAHLKYAMCLAEEGQDSMALLELSKASAADRAGNARIVAWQIALNESYLLRWKDPAGALARLDEVNRLAGDALEIWLQRGYLAADRGNLQEAERLFERAESSTKPDADWLWEVALARAQLAERRGGAADLATAEWHYRRAAAMVAALRSSARARSAYLVSSHRGPYDGLIALLARQGRWREVLDVILELDASDMLRATAVERVATGRRAFDLATALNATNPAAPVPVSIDAVLKAWRGRELVIVVAEGPRQIAPGSERVYRLRVRDGEVSGQDVGPASDARKWAAALFTHPGDRKAARGLGQMMVPADRATTTLDVLAIGALGRTPLAALRGEDDTLIVGARPLARVLALRSRRAESRGTGAPVVLADPRGNLPNSVTEGEMVAAQLAPAVRSIGLSSGAAATTAQLWAAKDAALLHFAGHVGVRDQWRALELADGEVDPTEILTRGLAPRLAVLAACGSAAATDEEGWGSIAAALLEAGTSFVVATDRTVGDRASLALMKAFYAQPGWRTDPARALAGAQQAMHAAAVSSGADDGSWAAFSVIARPPVVLE